MNQDSYYSVSPCLGKRVRLGSTQRRSGGEGFGALVVLAIASAQGSVPAAVSEGVSENMRRTSWAIHEILFCLLLASPVALSGEEDLGPDSQRQEGVPRGTVTEKDFTSTKVYPGTYRKYWLYVPAQYKADKPACVMIFQDGFQYVMDVGARVPIVFDNLIHKKEMPVTIAILVNPGVYPIGPDRPKQESNRSVEYDTLSDQYARFLLEEILPEVAKDYNLTTDPAGRAICGSVRAVSARSPPPGKNPMLSARSSAISAASPTFVVATSIPPSSERHPRNQFASSCRMARMISTIRTATGL